MQPPQTASREDETGDKGFVSDYLLYLLAAASEAASAQFHAHVRSHGLRVPEWRVLAWLHDRDGAMITRLARISLIEQSRLTRIIIQMEERGLVLRKGDTRDRRRVRVHLTEKGRGIAETLVADARAHEAALLAQLEGGDGARLKPALAALLARLDPDEQTRGESGA
ncbi:MAG: transcriptional regulator, MarR family [Rhodobacteraceae bacterium HLUCCO07]|nr:MAG: transcriptional regulator, MarR family [Rhodobacteraceae bacterium HLUCCO07]